MRMVVTSEGGKVRIAEPRIFLEFSIHFFWETYLVLGPPKYIFIHQCGQLVVAVHVLFANVSNDFGKPRRSSKTIGSDKVEEAVKVLIA